MKSTLASVAAEAGVSKTTASLILNNRDTARFPERTRRKVQEAAERLRYQVASLGTRAARGAKVSRNGVIAFIHTRPLRWQIHNRQVYFADIIDGIQTEARRAGFHLYLATGLADLDQKLEYLRTARDTVDGFLIGGAVEEQVLEYFRRERIPAVNLGDRLVPQGSIHAVYGDSSHGGYLAAKHLLDLGHRRIGFVGALRNAAFYRTRLAGFIDAHYEAGVQPDLSLAGDPDDPEGLAGFVARLMAAPDRPTAIFAAQQNLAEQTLVQLRELGIRVPDEVSVVGFDNLPTGVPVEPPLTTIDLPREQIGALGFRRLLELIGQPNLAPATSLVPAELVARGSTSHPPR